MAPTSGFSLPALPRPLSLPARIGEIDTRDIYDSVRAGLQTVEAARSAPMRSLLADEQGRTAIAETEAQRAILPSATQATIEQAPLRTRLLASQAEGAPIQNQLLAMRASDAQLDLNAQEAERARIADLRKRAAVEMPAFLQEREQAHKLADYNATAAALGSLRVKYPWLALPDFKDTHSKTLDSEERAAMDAAKATADRESREDIAKTRAGSTTDAARVRAEASKTAAALRGGPSAWLQRQADLIEQVSLFPDDAGLAQQLDSVNALLRNVQASEMKNPNIAKTTTPTAEFYRQSVRRARDGVDAAGTALEAALDTGDEEEIALSQRNYDKAKAEAESAQREYDLYHAERAKKTSGKDMAAAIEQISSRFGGKGTPASGTAPNRAAPPAAPAPAGEWTEMTLPSGVTVKVRKKS